MLRALYYPALIPSALELLFYVGICSHIVQTYELVPVLIKEHTFFIHIVSLFR